MDKVSLNGMMETLTMDSLKIIIFKAKVRTFGKMVGNSKATGSITKFKAMVSSPGLMAENTRAPT